jgi:3-phenylpropionate/trans-cinnamate dioxygenase ferredoxin reductase subunit
MKTDVNAIVIIGAGLSGDTAAAALRTAGFQGSITLVSDEPHRPYDRPPLSKAALISADEAQKIFFHPATWYEEKNIVLVLGDRAAHVDPRAHSVTLTSGRSLSYDKLLIATGTRARRLRLLENAGASIFYLRTLDDSEALRSLLKPGARLAIIGAGVIGMEVAASAVSLGCQVSVIELADRVMARSVSPTASRFLTEYHRREGVQILCGVKIIGVGVYEGRAAIELDGGTRIEADAVAAGVGAEPVTELAQEAGLRVEDGIIVDRHTRTSDPDIHAAGDVARFHSQRQGRHIRAEHWRHAIEQANIAALAMLGDKTPYEERPWVWSDQYELNIQITGEGNGEVEVVRGRPEDGRFTIFQLQAGRLVGAVTVNQSKFKRQIAELVDAQPTLDPAVLADPSTDLNKLVADLAKY